MSLPRFVNIRETENHILMINGSHYLANLFKKVCGFWSSGFFFLLDFFIQSRIFEPCLSFVQNIPGQHVLLKDQHDGLLKEMNVSLRIKVIMPISKLQRHPSCPFVLRAFHLDHDQ